MVGSRNSVRECGSLRVVTLLVLWHLPPTVHSGLVLLASLFHFSTFSMDILKILLKLTMRSGTISSVSPLPPSPYSRGKCSLYRLVHLYLLLVDRYTPIVNCILRTVFHSHNGIPDACDRTLSWRGCELDQGWWMVRFDNCYVRVVQCCSRSVEPKQLVYQVASWSIPMGREGTFSCWP